MEVSLIPDHILDDLHSRGLNDADIESSTPEHLFNEYLNWNGIIGYGDTFIEAIDSLRSAEKA